MPAPTRPAGHRRARADDPLATIASAPDMAVLLVDLPPVVLSDLALGPLVRSIATGTDPESPARERLAGAAWRAITRGS